MSNEEIYKQALEEIAEIKISEYFSINYDLLIEAIQKASLALYSVESRDLDE